VAKKEILGLFTDAGYAAEAGDALERAGLTKNDYDFLTDTPYPEGALGERHISHKVYIFPFIGAMLGLTVAILITAGTQVSYPLITGGKPVLSIPAMAIISYEGTMLGAILFTVLGIIFESRLPYFRKRLYDDRITEGYIGLVVEVDDSKISDVERALTQAGAVEIKRAAA
jgi:hypothetical protein